MHNNLVVITRPVKQCQHLIALLEAQGNSVAMFPMFEIASLSDFAILDLQLRRLETFTLVVFVSPNAIDAFFRRLEHLKIDRNQELQLAVMGESSRMTLVRYGVDFSRTRVWSPGDKSRTDSETLLRELDLNALRGKSVLIIRGDSGRDFFSDALREAGVEVTQVSAYRRLIPNFDIERQQRLLALLSSSAGWVVTSSEVLPHLLAWSEKLGGQELVAKMQQQALFVPHRRIAEKAKESGFQRITLTASGDENLALALQSSYERST